MKLRTILTRRNIILFASNAVPLILLAVCVIRMNTLAGMLQSQQMAERWTGSSEMHFTQISCFLPYGAELEETDIYRFRSDLNAKLTENSIKPPEGGTLWSDAYSVSGQVQINGSKGSATVLAIGVGGDYFAFHPLRLYSGVYIIGDDLMRDRVILDVEMAWKIFGALNVAGMQVTISGLPFIVAGVVEREGDFATELAYPESAGLYMSIDALQRLGGSTGPLCYEIVLPNPITGFAAGIVKDVFPYKGEFELVENSGRFNLTGILKILENYGKRSMRIGNVPFPYWENAARAVEDLLALTFILAVIFALYPAGFALIVTIRFVRKLYSKRVIVKQKLEDIYEKIRTRPRKEKKPR